MNDYSETIKDTKRYNILLLLTNRDMCEEDIELTHHQIVRASALPISIIIIGIDDDDFVELKKLDADTNPLYSKETKTYQQRDCVQFVPFNINELDAKQLAS